MSSEEAAEALEVDEALPGGLRRLGPVGAPGVGDPPVAARALLRACAKVARDEDRAAAAKRAHPHLSDAEVRAVLEAQDLDPRLLDVRATWGQAIALALPLGLGTYLFTLGLLGVAGRLLFVTLTQLAGGPGAEGDPSLADAELILVGLSLAVGGGLVRLAPWSRLSAMALGVLLVGLFALGPDHGASLVGGLGVAGLTLACLALGHRTVAAWFTPDGRAASAALPVTGYKVAVAWSALVGVALTILVGGFQRVFEELGVVLPTGSRILVDLGSTARTYGFVLLPLLVVGFAPLLRLDPRHERTLRWSVWTLGFVAFGNLCLWLGLPLHELFEKL